MASDHPTVPFAAYSGDGPFVFVSYDHGNAAGVYAEIELLSAVGFNVWYDEGISPGHVWPKELATRIENCAAFLVFVTPQSVQSPNCARELNFALENEKPVLSVHLATTELPSEWRFSIGDRQAILKDRMSTELYEQKLIVALEEYVPRSEPTTPVGDDDLSSGDVGVAEPEPVAGSRAPAGRRGRWIGVAAAIAAVVAGFFAFERYQNRAGEAAWLADSLAMVREHVENDAYGPAYQLAREIEHRAGSQTVGADLWNQMSVAVGITTEPPGAGISVRVYSDAEGWLPIGESPLETIRLPLAVLVLKIEKEGYETAYRVTHNPGLFTRNAAYDVRIQDFFGRFDIQLPTIVLTARGNASADMVVVPETDFPLQFAGFDIVESIQIPAYSIDRTEVTNRAYSEFVAAGGYENPEYWQALSFVDESGPVQWREAARRFTDKTGKPGPATWEFGTFPPGRDDHPVAGISWFEAMAYAAFRDKRLPTLGHWVRAAVLLFECCEPIAPSLMRFSNFGDDTLPVASTLGVGPYGTHDMAGNVREWIWNAADDHRLIMGAAHTDAPYVFHSRDHASPWDRSVTNGVRLATWDDAPEDFLSPIDMGLAPNTVALEDLAPVPDDVFHDLVTAFSKPLGRMEPRVDYEKEMQFGTLRKVSLRTGASEERFPIYLLHPNSAPPYQTTVFMGGVGGFMTKNEIETELHWNEEEIFSMLLRSGRAVVWPVFYGSFERYDDLYSLPPEQFLFQGGERRKRWAHELARTIDYLESTGEHTDGVSFMGLSYGASYSLPLLYLESRIKAAILLSGSVPTAVNPPATAPVNFVPHITTPALLLNGRFDYMVPVEGSQKTYNLLGTPEADKKLVIYDTGHWPFPRHRMTREINSWLDRYAGAVD